MRLTPQQSQLEVESSSPESLAPGTPVRNGNVRKRRTNNVRSSTRSSGIDQTDLSIPPAIPPPSDSPHSQPIHSGHDASGSHTNIVLGDCRSEERTLDDELLDLVEDAESVHSIDLKLPPRHTLEPDVSIAMAVLNNELPPTLQPDKSSLVETETATGDTGNERTRFPANVPQQNGELGADEDLIEVLVEGEAAKDTCRAPSLTQLDTRLRSGLTKFVFLAPATPGPVRGALVTRASPSQSSDAVSNGDARCEADPRSSTGRQDEAEATELPLRIDAPRISAEEHNPNTGTIARRVSSLLTWPSASTGNTSATARGEEIVPEIGIIDLAPSAVLPAAGPGDRRECLQPTSSSEQPSFATEHSPGYVARASVSHSTTNAVQVNDVADVVGVPAPWSAVDCACQADLMAWPCATPSCEKRSERSLASRHCLGQVEKFEVVEKPNMSHSSTCVNPSGSPLCWECGLEHRRKVVRSRKQRAKARRHLQRPEVKAGSACTGHETRDVSGKRKLDADGSSDAPQPPAKRISNIEASSCGLLLTSPISYQLVQVERITPEFSDKSSQRANEAPAGDRTPVLSKRSLPVGSQIPSKTRCAETASSSTQTEESWQRTGRAASSSSSPQTASSRHASKTPSPLCAVQTVGETPPSSPPPLSPSAGRGRSGSGAASALSHNRPPSPTRLNVLMEQCATAPAQSSRDGDVSSTPDASKNHEIDTEEQSPNHLYFCECGRDLTRFAEKLPCKTCINEQYWQLLAETEAGDAAARGIDVNEIAQDTSHSAELCYMCSKLVAFDEQGLCIPCANPLVSGSREAAKRQRRDKKRREQGGEQMMPGTEKQVPASGMNVVVDLVVTTKQVKMKPLKSILKRR